jgi:hypothetical protein
MKLGVGELPTQIDFSKDVSSPFRMSSASVVNGDTKMTMESEVREDRGRIPCASAASCRVDNAIT